MASTTINRGAFGAFSGSGAAGATLTLEDLELFGNVSTGGSQAIAIGRVNLSYPSGSVSSLDGDIAIADRTVGGSDLSSFDGSIIITDTSLTGGSASTNDGSITVTDSSLINSDGIGTSGGAVTLTRTDVANPLEGIVSITGAVSLVDSTITNSADECILTDSGNVTLTRSTIDGCAEEGIQINATGGA